MHSQGTIDLNCDCGESFGAWTMGADAAVLPWVSSANIACGFHAGDAQTMLRTIDLCVVNEVQIGAHPGLRDLQGFGRREMHLSAADLYAETLYQLGALSSLCRSRGAHMRHVKPHGALYHQVDQNRALADALVAACVAAEPTLQIYGPPDGQLQAASAAAGLHYLCEGFVERGYGADGRLLPRSAAGAVLHDAQQIIAQASDLALHGRVRVADAESANPWLQLSIQTLCIHGDRPDAATLAQHVHQALQAQGLQVRAPSVRAAQSSL